MNLVLIVLAVVSASVLLGLLIDVCVSGWREIVLARDVIVEPDEHEDVSEI